MLLLILLHLLVICMLILVLRLGPFIVCYLILAVFTAIAIVNIGEIPIKIAHLALHAIAEVTRLLILSILLLDRWSAAHLEAIHDHRVKENKRWPDDEQPFKGKEDEL